MPTIRRAGAEDASPARQGRLEAHPFVEPRAQIDLDTDFSGEDLRRLRNSGVLEAEDGLPDPRRPLGMTALVEDSAASIERKTYDRLLQSLTTALDFVNREKDSLPTELSDIAAQVLQDEILRTRATANKAHGLIEV